MMVLFCRFKVFAFCSALSLSCIPTLAFSDVANADLNTRVGITKESSDVAVVKSTAKNADAQALVALLKNMDSIAGRFDQTITDPDGSVLQATKGTYKIKRPGFLYWETLPPYEQIIVSDSQTLWVYDPDLEQVTIRNGRDLDKGPAYILNGNLDEINNQYTISKLESGKSNSIGFVLMPKNTRASSFASVSIWFVDDKVNLIEMLDKLSQITLIQFSETIINANMSDSVFAFTPPAGVDIVTDN